MARTGLRMMPTFPLPPLKFRTAGFPRYGFKIGISDGAFPGYPGLPSSFVLSACIVYSLLCVRVDALVSTSMRADQPLYPRGPRSGPGYAVPVHLHLFSPIRPTRRHIQTSPFAAYTRCLRCAYSHRPRQPTTGSMLSLLFLLDMPPSTTTGSPSAACAQFFADDDSLRRQFTGSALPSIPSSASDG
jgi:hypothetical protein